MSRPQALLRRLWLIGFIAYLERSSSERPLPRRDRRTPRFALRRTVSGLGSNKSGLADRARRRDRSGNAARLPSRLEISPGVIPERQPHLVAAKTWRLRPVLPRADWTPQSSRTAPLAAIRLSTPRNLLQHKRARDPRLPVGDGRAPRQLLPRSKRSAGRSCNAGDKTSDAITQERHRQPRRSTAAAFPKPKLKAVGGT